MPWEGRLRAHRGSRAPGISQTRLLQHRGGDVRGRELVATVAKDEVAGCEGSIYYYYCVYLFLWPDETV